MTIAPLDLILLLGAAQGFILATLLWINPKGRRLSNRLLAVLIGLLALISLSMSIPIWNKWVDRVLIFLPWVMAMPLGPLIYFYVKSVLDPAFRVGRLEQRQFWPVLLDWGAPIIGWVFLAGVWLGAIEPQTRPDWANAVNSYNIYVDLPRWLSVTAYSLVAKRLLGRYLITGNHSINGQSQLLWLRQFVHTFLVFQLIWFVHLVPYLMSGTRSALLDSFGWYPIYIPITILIYWLGLRGYVWSRTEARMTKAAATEVSPETVAQVVAALTKAMQIDRLFLDPELTVDKVGKHTQLSPRLISAVLNQHVQQNFNGFVNAYRVEEVKRQLTNPANTHLTLTGIAFESGFNSQATFQRTFKQRVGLSPGEFMDGAVKKDAQIQI